MRRVGGPSYDRILSPLRRPELVQTHTRFTRRYHPTSERSREPVPDTGGGVFSRLRCQRPVHSGTPARSTDAPEPGTLIPGTICRGLKTIETPSKLKNCPNESRNRGDGLRSPPREAAISGPTCTGGDDRGEFAVTPTRTVGSGMKRSRRADSPDEGRGPTDRGRLRATRGPMPWNPIELCWLYS